jgi:hypothetical protein
MAEKEVMDLAKRPAEQLGRAWAEPARGGYRDSMRTPASC